ncbi:MAG: ABC transporter ATP-binding protein [Oscillospiraceae bacterium]|jgi:branched-chain amino acid transport system ATP-binding protein|nr:ABC transporter ATP-binding protein [Oscillospiraceae bacterium]
MKILEGIGVTRAFGGRRAVDNVDFDVEEGEILGLIGPNGAGKTTLFNLISGAISADSGTVTYKGRVISGMKPYRICHMGLARTFQKAKNFPDMTVRENVLMGAIFGKKGADGAAAEKKTDEILSFVGLEQFRDKSPADIALALQKRVEVARALATSPDVLMLDEVMAGLNPTEVGEAMELISKIRGSGVTIIMIEHVMKAIMTLCDRIIVLHHGQKIEEGTPDQISNSKTVIDIYLGE